MSKRNGSYLLVFLIATIGVATAWTSNAFDQPSKTAAKTADDRPLKPGQIDVEKSRVFIRVGKKGLGHEHAVAGKIKSGSIDLAANEALGEIEFDMQSFAADADEARQYVELKGTIAESTREQITRTMLGAAVLDVEKFPNARFKIKSRKMVRDDGELRYLLKGDFTLHGKTREITVSTAPPKLVEKEARWHLTGDFTILQSDFGITPYKAALGTVGVADELKIRGDIRVVK